MTTKKTEKKATKKTAAAKKEKGRYVIVRCRDAGVHAGEYVSHKGREVVLENSRRIWYWSGAASLSELAVYGAKNVSACKFGVAVVRITLADACEIIECCEDGAAMICNCPEWRP
jgi:hypothetical protein